MNEQINPDEITADAVVREIERINPTILQLAVSNIRAGQWREYAMSLSEGKDGPELVAVTED